jgi:hypothetical protein
MPRQPFTRAFLLGLALALAAPAAWAAPQRHEAPASAWSLVAQLWQTLTASWLDSGCSLDPDGRCAKAAAPDSGCSLDPSGRCAGKPLSSAIGESGCTVDPDGRCARGGTTQPSATIEHGCSVDPNGGCSR